MKPTYPLRVWSTLLTCGIAVAIFGCAASKPKAPERIPVFDYRPPSTATPGSANVTLAILNAKYGPSLPAGAGYPFTQVASSMGSDFQEALAAKGVNTKGPFRTYDEITFPDKQGSDLVLQPTLDLVVDVQGRSEEVIVIIGDNVFKLKGTGTISGRLDLALTESLSNERMWYKSIDITPVSFSWEGEKRYRTPPAMVDYTDPGLNKQIAAIMEPLYQQLMQSAWDYLNPEELAMVKQQAQVIKEKKVY